MTDQDDDKKSPKKTKNAIPGAKPDSTMGKLLRFYKRQEPSRNELVACIKLLAEGAANGSLRSFFAVAITDSGQPLEVVFVEPSDRALLIEAINEELTRFLGSKHHIISVEHLEEFLSEQGISQAKLAKFMKRKNLERV